MLFRKFLEQETARGGKKRNFKTSRGRRPAKEVRIEISKFLGARDRHKTRGKTLRCQAAMEQKTGRRGK